MRRQKILTILFWVLSLALFGCILTAAPTVTPAVLTSAPEAETLTPTLLSPNPAASIPAPSETPVPPTITATAVDTIVVDTPVAEMPDASATAYVASGPVIAKFASGQDFAITFIRMNDAFSGWAIG
ncbi:MAG: hypothetical protein EHM70_14830, partial [Chloroflexota bacterium]